MSDVERIEALLKDRADLYTQVQIAVEALEALKQSAESYMKYHSEKFYEGQGLPPLNRMSGLWPAIRKADKALAQIRKEGT
jgi:hypothetical protein